MHINSQVMEEELVLGRQMMGEQLSGLSVEDLKKLEHQLELSLRDVRMKKVIDVVTDKSTTCLI